MNCSKCNKVTKRGEILSLGKCSKCVSLCNFEQCKKKSFKNGYCHCHVIHGVQLKLTMGPKIVTEEEKQRRINNAIKLDQFDREVRVVREQIANLRSEVTYEDMSKRDRIHFMEENLKDLIDNRRMDLDDEIENLKSYYRNLPSNTIPKKSKFTSWFERDKDRSSESKKTNQNRKANRTGERSGQSENKEKNDESDNASDDESDNEYYSGDREFKNLVIEAFVMFGIPKTRNLTDIKTAYRKKALEVHPDKNNNKDDGINYTELFQELSKAYEFININISKI